MKLRRILGSVVIAVLILLLVACGSAISAGRITHKEVRPAYTWIQMVCSAYDKNGLCVVQMPITHHEPERYRFDIKDDSDKTGYVYVTAETFDNYNVGDWIDFGN